MEAAHIIPSFLARDIRDGRIGVQVNRYTARLLVGDANGIIAPFGPPAPIYLHIGDIWTTIIEAAATIIPGKLRSDQHSEKLFT